MSNIIENRDALSAEQTHGSEPPSSAPRFKIDFDGSSYMPFGLFFQRPFWHSPVTRLTWWKRLDIFRTQDEARELYDKIKNLPEYLA